MKIRCMVSVGITVICVILDQPLYAQRLSVIADSLANQYSLVGTHIECFGYYPVIGGLGFVSRGFTASGTLNSWQTDSIFSLFVSDQNVYNDEFGPARYPSYAVIPHLCILFTSGYGVLGMIYESGGWWSSTWNPPVEIGVGNPGAVICAAKALPNGNICLIIYGTNPFCVMYRTYSADMGTLLSSGTLSGNNTYYWGWDSNLNGGIAYVFYCDDNLNIYYRTTTDGITWTSEQSYNLVWPNPYTNNMIDQEMGVQACVTNTGNPILVFNVLNGDDGEWPPYGKIYVSIASGQPCIEVSSAFGMPDTECTRPTIATGSSNEVVVIYCTPRNNLPDSLCFWDIFYNYSTDNGLTWNTPTNITSSDPVNHCMPHLAKRMSSFAFYYVYGTAIVDSSIDLTWIYYAGGTLPTRWYVGTFPSPGVAEQQAVMPDNLTLSVKPNPFKRTAQMSYSVGSNPRSAKLGIYDASGRLVVDLSSRLTDYGLGSTVVWSGTDDIGKKLPAGVYLVVLESGKQKITRKIVMLQ